MNTPIEAYYMVPKNGGFQVYRLHIEDGVVLDGGPLSDPDAWEQSLSVLEQALSLQFQ